MSDAQTLAATKAQALRELLDLADSCIATAEADPRRWELVYDVVFSEIRPEVRRISGPFDYYDPDTSFEEDVRAYVEALRSRVDFWTHVAQAEQARQGGNPAQPTTE